MELALQEAVDSGKIHTPMVVVDFSKQAPTGAYWRCRRRQSSPPLDRRDREDHEPPFSPLGNRHWFGECGPRCLGQRWLKPLNGLAFRLACPATDFNGCAPVVPTTRTMSALADGSVQRKMGCFSVMLVFQRPNTRTTRYSSGKGTCWSSESSTD